MRLKPKTIRIQGRTYDITKKKKRGIFPHKFNPNDFKDKDAMGSSLLYDMIYELIAEEPLNEAEREYIDGLTDSMGDLINRLLWDYENETASKDGIKRNESVLNEKFRELHKFFNKKRLFIDMDQLLDAFDAFEPEDIAEFNDYIEDHIVPNPYYGRDEYEPEVIGNPAFSTIKGTVEQDLIDRQNQYFIDKYNKGQLDTLKNIIGSYVRNYTWHFGGLYSGANKWRRNEYESLTREGKRALIRDIKRRDRYTNKAIREAPGLEDNVILMRGGRWKDFEVGSIGEFDYITSASFNPNTAKQYQKDDTLIRILAPKGSKVLSINESDRDGAGSIFRSIYNNDNQNEVLIARGQKYLVLDVGDYYDKRLHMRRREVTIMLINEDSE